MHRASRKLLEAAPPLVAVEQVLRQDDLAPLEVAVAAAGAAGQHQPDLPGVRRDVVAPSGFEVIEDLLAQVSAGALELQQDVHAVPVADPRLDVGRRGRELAPVVAERLRLRPALLELQWLATEGDHATPGEMRPQPRRAPLVVDLAGEQLGGVEEHGAGELLEQPARPPAGLEPADGARRERERLRRLAAHGEGVELVPEELQTHLRIRVVGLAVEDDGVAPHSEARHLVAFVPVAHEALEQIGAGVRGASSQLQGVALGPLREGGQGVANVHHDLLPPLVPVAQLRVHGASGAEDVGVVEQGQPVRGREQHGGTRVPREARQAGDAGQAEVATRARVAFERAVDGVVHPFSSRANVRPSTVLRPEEPARPRRGGRTGAAAGPTPEILPAPAGLHGRAGDGPHGRAAR